MTTVTGNDRESTDINSQIRNTNRWSSSMLQLDSLQNVNGINFFRL